MFLKTIKTSLHRINADGRLSNKPEIEQIPGSQVFLSADIIGDSIIIDFEKKLECINLDDISTESYCKEYLSYLLVHKKYYLSVYVDLLNKLLKQSFQGKKELILLDYGAGNGLLGIFAKYCGFKKVFLADINVSFVKASKKLSQQLNIDGFISGDIAVVRSSLNAHSINSVVGTDVIEHIYDLHDFFLQLKEINPFITSVFTTASNPQNYFKVKALKKMQLKDELEGGKPEDHILFGNAHEPFFEMRRQIIEEKYADLEPAKVSELAKLTRGMIKPDMLQAIDKYTETGALPKPAKGTNTCHPLIGSWSERILSLKEYRNIYKAAGFDIKFYSGFYDVNRKSIKTTAKKIANYFIPVFGNRIAPYVIIVGYANVI